MNDNTRINELQEKLLQAMDIINAKALQSVSYDKTITCTVEDDSDKQDGKYEVSDGSIIFTAYSTDERYRNGDVVYVTIPQGNYENQKIIIGKQTAENDKPFNFVTPFDSFFPMTQNLIPVEARMAELIANDVEVCEDEKGNKWTKEKDNCLTYISLFQKEGLDTKDMDLISYGQLGLKADFKSWVKEAVRGNYGLALILTTSKPNTINGEDEITEHAYILDSNKMYGNPYNFETFYSQELVIDLKNQNIGKVINIQLYFYQMANFYDQFDHPIPNSTDGYKTQELNSNIYLRHKTQTGADDGYYISKGDKLLSNLFVNNIELYFGYDISLFENDYVEIYTQDSGSYRRSTDINNPGIKDNQKTINMRWVHMKDGKPVNMVAEADEMIGSDQPNYEVRWYRYRVGATAADPYCGIYWERMYVEKLEKEYLLRDWTEADKIDNKIDYGELTAFQKLIFNPDVNKQQETIKAIVIYEGNTPYRSNDLIFENEEQLPPSAEAQHIMNALVIECVDKSNGNYMIYGQDNSIKDTKYSKENRILEAYFDVNNNGQIDGDEEKISDDGIKNLIWTFPKDNSMIELLNGDPTGELDENEKEILSKSIVTGRLPEYKISSYYSPSKANNTIFCQYTLNGVVYTTEKEFTFGPAGTMGTDQTLVIDFIGDKNSVVAAQDKVVSFEVQLYDNQNKLQIIPDDSEVTWAWYYNSDLKDEDGKILNFPQPIEGETNAVLNSEYKFKLGSLYILQASVGNLTTYFPIPVSNSLHSYIKGPTQVIYQSNGEPSYNRENYQLFNKSNEPESDVVWQIITDNEIESYKLLGNITEEEFNKNKKYLCIKDNDNIYKDVTTFNASDKYYKKIYSYIGTINEDRLEPLNIYIKDAPVYGIKATKGETVLWTQPILVLQNLWPNAVINAWDGKSLVLDETTSTVIAAAISAGKKNSNDNTFSGVMIGDWEGQDVEGSITKQTGIYGFHHGAMSYALTEDGNAFFGKDGKGRICINGDNATIYSPDFDKTNNPQGMKIDLNDASIYMKYSGNIIKLDAGETRSVSGFSTMSKAPFTIGDKFAVAWDGTLYATGGNFKGTISGSTLQSSTKDNRIGLNGYFELSNGAYFGEILADLPGLDKEKYTGIGMSIWNEDEKKYGTMKVTMGNVGMSFGEGYIAINNTHTTQDGVTLTDCIVMGSNAIDLGDIDPENQYGIYARFA